MRNRLAFLLIATGLVFTTNRTFAGVEWDEMFPGEPDAVDSAPTAVPKAAEPAAPQKGSQPAVKPMAEEPAQAPPAAKRVAPDAVVEEPATEPVAPKAAAGSVKTTAISLADVGLTEGAVIDQSNMETHKDILTPGLEWAIGYGLRMKMIEQRHAALPRKYREATEKYAAQVSLGPRGQSLNNYVAGQPFPAIDVNDPDAAMKIMWNFYMNGILTDDLDARLFDADTGSIAKNGPMSVERHYIIDHLRRLSYIGRLYVDPKPNMPNDEGYRYKESLHPLLEPFDLKGVGATFYRYVDPARQDDSWLYLPQLRRVRRLSTAQRSDALFGQDSDADSYYGYNGHIAWNDYRLIGERVVPAVAHGKNAPAKFQSPEDWIYDDVWEPRKVYVIEAVSKLSQYAYGKRVLFLDQEVYFITHSDIYDRAGQLWKIWFNSYSFKKKESPSATLSVYEDEMPFQHAITMIDTQLAHATKAALPSTKARPGEECVFFNMGEKSGTTEEFFTIADLIGSGH